MSEREKPPHVEPMNGRDALAMFNDGSLLALEQQQARLGAHVDDLSRQIALAYEDPEADWEAVSQMESDLTTTRETLQATNKEIRHLGQDFGNKRGVRTLH